MNMGESMSQRLIRALKFFIHVSCFTRPHSTRRLRQRFNSYPGRPQLLKFSSMTLRDEAESKMEKFSAILEAELLNLKALKELSWQGVPRKVKLEFAT
jgi:hypothetical protein